MIVKKEPSKAHSQQKQAQIERKGRVTSAENFFHYPQFRHNVTERNFVSENPETMNEMLNHLRTLSYPQLFGMMFGQP